MYSCPQFHSVRIIASITTKLQTFKQTNKKTANNPNFVKNIFLAVYVSAFWCFCLVVLCKTSASWDYKVRFLWLQVDVLISPGTHNSEQASEYGSTGNIYQKCCSDHKISVLFLVIFRHVQKILLLMTIRSKSRKTCLHFQSTNNSRTRRELLQRWKTVICWMS